MRATISEHEDFCRELGKLHDILTELNGRLEAIDNRCGADFIHMNINELMTIDCASGFSMRICERCRFGCEVKKASGQTCFLIKTKEVK